MVGNGVSWGVEIVVQAISDINRQISPKMRTRLLLCWRLLLLKNADSIDADPLYGI